MSADDPWRPPAAPPPDAALTVDTLEQFKALSHPLRQRMLERFGHEPRTTKQVAEQLGEKPTRLYHHVAALEKAGLIRLVATRQKRGTTEKYYSAVARRFTIDPRLFQGEVGGTTPEALALSMLEQMFDRTRQEVRDLAAALTKDGTAPLDPEVDPGLFAHVEVKCGAARLQRLREQIDELLQFDEDEDEDESDTESYRLMIAHYPLRPRDGG